MTKEEVDRMIDRQGVYEIKYGRYIIHIGVIKWSEIHSDCIWCYCNEWGIYITLNYKKIETCKQYWTETWDNKELAQQTGLHLFACRGDNHLITEIYWFNEGEPLWKYFEKEFGHSNGWMGVIPLAYHCVDKYLPNESCADIWQSPRGKESVRNKKTSLLEVSKHTAFLQDKTVSAQDDSGYVYYLLDNGDYLRPVNVCEEAIAVYEYVNYADANFLNHMKMIEDVPF
jgi:hypothetical protein